MPPNVPPWRPVGGSTAAKKGGKPASRRLVRIQAPVVPINRARARPLSGSMPVRPVNINVRQRIAVEICLSAELTRENNRVTFNIAPVVKAGSTRHASRHGFNYGFAFSVALQAKSERAIFNAAFCWRSSFCS